MRPLISCITLGSVLLTGCASLTRTPYHAPQVSLPAHYQHAQPAAAGLRADTWWRAYGDPQLDAWVDLALARNPDLAAAAIRVRRATLEARLAGNALLPAISGNVGTGVSRPLSGNPRTTAESGSATLGVNWELDLFDRLGAQRDVAVFEAQASAEDRDAVALSLIGTTAGLYWQLGLANERMDLAEQSLAYARRTRELVQAQYRSGAVSGLEPREAEQSLAQQQAQLSQWIQVRTELLQALGVLFDGAAAPGGEPRRLPASALPPIGAGLPAELLGRRPDLRAAELRLRATLAASDAATARYYPSLSLTSALGTSSTALLQVLRNPVATLGANLTLPLLNVREMRLNTAIARTRHEEAVVMFRKSLYTALTEVEKALSARTQLAEQDVSQQRVRDEAAEIERLYEARYRAGQVPLRAWLDAQERRRSADSALAALHLALLQNHVTLVQALGGTAAQ
ncbi:efflux transporter outer membrane subunit [Burkholderia anthina]|uniref:efflux transporter outer membrane subunit n=1 Tax=Burkholderia anthina TaxID=179879 RepID=UPI00158BAC69|nr:efflux transporter outer membrane subunit [Burkholderia anthina]